jgi:hypothetical protein
MELIMTYFTNLDQAKFIAEINSEDAWHDRDDWTYKVEKRGKYWVVAVEDEDGELLGYL